ncbi:MAG TPA: hypothetical protein VIM61_05130 [Chthoniobacterales bacterium]|jgi:hypothetical protein
MSSRPFRFGTGALFLLGALCLLAPLHSADAKVRKRVGWQGFAAKYLGGYTVSPAIDTATGPAKIRITTSKDGRSARVTWKNTFYTEKGPYNIIMKWVFNPNGTVSVNTADPRRRNVAAHGTFDVNGNRPVTFVVKDATGEVTGTGTFKLNGGGSILITGKITGLPEGEVIFGFSGGRM